MRQEQVAAAVTMKFSNILGTVTILMCLTGFSKQQDQISVTQSQAELEEMESNLVSLECSYTTSYSYYYLFWYKQDREGTLTVLFSQHSDGSASNKAGNRFSVEFKKSTTGISLKISNLQVEDSAVYFCALGELYEGPSTDKLVFGKGTRLTVEPRNQALSTPSVFVLTSDDAGDGTSACLAKNFYPKELQMSMNSTTESTAKRESKAVLSKSGKYSSVQIYTFKEKQEVQCTVSHQGKEIKSYGSVIKTDPKPSSPSLPKASTCKPKPRSIDAKVESNEKVNMVSLTVLGLRVLFAKSLAFNVLLSVRVFTY